MARKTSYRPVVLCVLDGWGHRQETEHNAIALAETPVWDRLTADRAWGLLATAGEAVGLPQGQMGNSEVGHMTIGAGRVVLQDLPRIDDAVADGSLARNPALLSLIRRLRESGGRCHLMGLVSPGGVHSHQDHMAALVRIVSGAGVPVAIHAFLDGRDVPPRSAIDDLPRFEAALRDLPDVRIATVAGRYYAMDRDRRWERTARAYDALVSALRTPGGGRDRGRQRELCERYRRRVRRARSDRRLRGHGRRRRTDHGQLPRRPRTPSSSRHCSTPPSTALRAPGTCASPQPQA